MDLQLPFSSLPAKYLFELSRDVCTFESSSAEQNSRPAETVRQAFPVLPARGAGLCWMPHVDLNSKRNRIDVVEQETKRNKEASVEFAKEIGSQVEVIPAMRNE